MTIGLTVLIVILIFINIYFWLEYRKYSLIKVGDEIVYIGTDKPSYGLYYGEIYKVCDVDCEFFTYETTIGFNLMKLHRLEYFIKL